MIYLSYTYHIHTYVLGECIARYRFPSTLPNCPQSVFSVHDFKFQVLSTFIFLYFLFIFFVFFVFFVFFIFFIFFIFLIFLDGLVSRPPPLNLGLCGDGDVHTHRG